MTLETRCWCGCRLFSNPDPVVHLYDRMAEQSQHARDAKPKRVPSPPIDSPLGHPSSNCRVCNYLSLAPGGCEHCGFCVGTAEVQIFSVPSVRAALSGRGGGMDLHPGDPT